jgi:hypothetical protein
MTKENYLPTEAENSLMEHIIRIKEKMDNSQPFNLMLVLQGTPSLPRHLQDYGPRC